MLSFQLLAYYATRLLLWHGPLRDLSIPLDAAIPFRPAWITVYALAYVTWLVNGLWIVSWEKEHAYRFAAAFAMSMVITAVIFVTFPVTMQRPQVVGDGLFEQLMRLLYRIDEPINLCPSLHVMVSYFCFRGTLGCRNILTWYKAASLAFLVLVCLSILFVKQHVFVDIPAALAVGELCVQLARALRLERVGLWLERVLKHTKEGKNVR